jgi:hypothetical protein
MSPYIYFPIHNKEIRLENRESLIAVPWATENKTLALRLRMSEVTFIDTTSSSEKNLSEVYIRFSRSRKRSDRAGTTINHT